MKSLKPIIILLLLALIQSSCNESELAKTSLHWEYSLAISFTDSEGKDLVKPLADEQWMSNPKLTHWAEEINPDKYTLDVIYSNPPDWYDNDIYNHRAYPGFVPDVNRRYFRVSQINQNMLDSPWYLTYYDYTDIDMWGEEVQNMVFKITCPSIFGDDSTHNVETCWEQGEKPEIFLSDAKCTKVVFDGKQYFPEQKVYVIHFESQDVERVYYAIDIVLDK